MRAYPKILRVGSRDSELAKIQAGLFIDAVRRVRPELRMELLTLTTSGDRILDRPLELAGGKGLFVKELEQALLAGRVDLCVHSYKDVPLPNRADLPILATLPREDPRDVLLTPAGHADGDHSLPLGTSSRRRRLQLAMLYPDWPVEPVRGNLRTRLRKMDQGLFGGLVLAAAGVRRIGGWDRVASAFGVDEMLPAAGQGILAVQGRAGERFDFLEEINDPASRDAALAERSFVEALGGGCASPVAAYAEIGVASLRLRGLYVDAEGAARKAELAGPRGDPDALGRALAESFSRRDGHD